MEKKKEETKESNESKVMQAKRKRASEPVSEERRKKVAKSGEKTNGQRKKKIKDPWAKFIPGTFGHCCQHPTPGLLIPCLAPKQPTVLKWTGAKITQFRLNEWDEKEWWVKPKGRKARWMTETRLHQLGAELQPS